MPSKQGKKNNPNKIEEINKPKKNKKFKIIKKIMGLIITFGLLCGAIAYALTSPLFNITSITVMENEKYSDDTYVKLSDLKLNDNIFKFQKQRIANNIKQNAYVDTVKIRRRLPNTVEITISERKVKFLIEMKDEEKYAYIDEAGNILEISEEKLEYLVLRGIKQEAVNVGKKLDETYLDRIKDIYKIQNIMDNNEIEKFDSIDIGNKYDYVLYFEKEAKDVYLGDVSNLETKVLYMKYILEEQKEIPGSIYLNQSKAYFSPK